jgi:polyhydroxybutyrate depolymerase
MMTRRLFLLSLAGLLTCSVPAQDRRAGDLPAGLQRLELEVDGITREALVYVPAAALTTNTPLVFVFHGHGGNARQAARSFAMHRHWPEAICVYPQGLNTPGQLTDPDGKRPGWQPRTGDHGDRDLKFFDALLARLSRDYRVDRRRIYATGHSNGGGFTYLLWAERGDVFAAVAPSSAVAVGGQALQLKPKPALHVAGEQDPLVKYSWQQRQMDTVRRLNGCTAAGQPWARYCTQYPSAQGTPFVAFIHPGGHELHPDAPAAMARFFQEHAQPPK